MQGALVPGADVDYHESFSAGEALPHVGDVATVRRPARRAVGVVLGELLDVSAAGPHQEDPVRFRGSTSRRNVGLFPGNRASVRRPLR